jgi:tetratricopeptide (TPR) repeat protein
MSRHPIWLAVIVALWCGNSAVRGDPPSSVREPVPSTTASADEELRSGLKLAHEGAWQEAIAAFDRALAIDPDSGEALFFRGQAEAANKDYPAALRSLAAALSHLPHEAAIYQAIAEIHAARGDMERAADALAIAAEIHLRQNAQAEARRVIARLRQVKPDAPQLAALEARAAGNAAPR